MEVLPDSGADISKAGQQVLSSIGHHIDHILTSKITPKTVNGLSMTPLGRIPVTIRLGQATYEDDIHIYPGIAGAPVVLASGQGLENLTTLLPTTSTTSTAHRIKWTTYTNETGGVFAGRSGSGVALPPRYSMGTNG